MRIQLDGSSAEALRLSAQRALDEILRQIETLTKDVKTIKDAAKDTTAPTIVADYNTLMATLRTLKE